MQTLLFFSEKPTELASRRRSRASDVASSLARIDAQLGRDNDREPDPLRTPSSRGLRIWCSED
jgi:hypothetical protein